MVYYKMIPNIPAAIAIVSFLLAFTLQICSNALRNASLSNQMNMKLRNAADDVLYASAAFGGVSLIFAIYAIFNQK